MESCDRIRWPTSSEWYGRRNAMGGDGRWSTLAGGGACGPVAGGPCNFQLDDGREVSTMEVEML